MSIYFIIFDTSTTTQTGITIHSCNGLAHTTNSLRYIVHTEQVNRMTFDVPQGGSSHANCINWFAKILISVPITRESTENRPRDVMWNNFGVEQRQSAASTIESTNFVIQKKNVALCMLGRMAFATLEMKTSHVKRESHSDETKRFAEPLHCCTL